MTDSEPPIASPAPAPVTQTDKAGPLPKAEAKASKTSTPLPMKLGNLLILGIIGFAVFNYVMGGVNPLSEATQANSQKILAEAGNTTAHSDDPRIEQLIALDAFNMLGKAFPKMRAGVLSETLKAGTGRAVFCGQTVTYRDDAGETRRVTLNHDGNPQAQGLIWGLQGAQMGETRKINIPKDFNASPFSNAKPETTTHIVSIISATPELPKAGEMPVKRFIERGGAGYDLRCGDPAIAHLTIWDNAGKKLFSSLGGAPVYFELGEGKGVPFGLELTAQQMGPAAAYTIILPSELIAPLHANIAQPTPPKELDVQPFPSQLVFPKNGVVIIDLDFPEKPPRKNTAAAQ